jgi:AraC-like DNA-binding protein/quercetin dioxygenase-like cupin family protein
MSVGDGFDVRSLAVTYRDGHRLEPHRHPWAQLIYARSGVMDVTTDRRLWFVPPTRAIWIPAGIEHAISITGEVALRTLYVAPDRAQAARRGLETLEVSVLLGELIVHIVSAGMLDPTAAEHDRLAGVLMDLIAAARGTDLVLPLPADPRAARLAEQIRASPADARTLEVLASDAGASLRTLQRCFTEETGMTIVAWRQKARLVYSAAALAEGARVSEAALDCGYQSPSAYIAAFRRQFGVTPGQFEGSSFRQAGDRPERSLPIDPVGV